MAASGSIARCAPAIKYAEDGFPVAARVAWDWQRYVGKLAADPGAAKHYLFNGAAPKEGDVIRFPALAQDAEDHRRQGRARLLRRRDRRRHGGDLGRARLVPRRRRISRAIAAMWSTPISTNYRGLDLLEIPPNGQGLTALVMLNILENFDLKALDPLGPERFHLVLEAARLGYAVRDTHIADAAHMRVAGRRSARQGLCAKELAAKIDHEQARQAADARRRPAATRSISPWSTATAWRCRSSIRSIRSFGLGICTEKTGIMLTNRGACFTLEPDHPNAFGPAKRPMHTIIPALAMRDGRCDMSFGVMGAHYQPMGHVQIVINMIDYGMDVQQAIDAPRFFFEGEQTDRRARHAGGDHRGPEGARPRCRLSRRRPGAARRPSRSIGIAAC